MAGEDSLEYGESLQVLSFLYQQLRNYEKVESILQKILGIKRNILESNPEYAIV